MKIAGHYSWIQPHQMALKSHITVLYGHVLQGAVMWTGLIER